VELTNRQIRCRAAAACGREQRVLSSGATLRCNPPYGRGVNFDFLRIIFSRPARDRTAVAVRSNLRSDLSQTCPSNYQRPQLVVVRLRPLPLGKATDPFHFPFAFSLASRSSRSALRRLWFAWNSGSAWLSDIVCLDASGLRALRAASSSTCSAAVRFGLIICFSPSVPVRTWQSTQIRWVPVAPRGRRR
jgi:hypothetical protein